MFFVEKHEARARVLNVDTGEEDKIDKSPMPGLFDNIKIIAERRPITEQAWDGEGLPPVGVECEVKGCIGDYREWKKVTVFAVRDKTVFFDHDCGWSATATHEFRPIRSTEDVARDEAIIDMLMVEGGMPDSYQPHELVAALYDAGYRKMD